MLEPVLDAVPPIRQCAGRPRRRPGKLHADKGYDYRRCRRACRKRGVIPRIARRGIESGERLGGTAGLSNARSPGSPASVGWRSATSAGPTSSKPSTTSPPP
jgi:hypothetical protein